MLANPRGFCAGVERAIEIVKVALNIYGAPIYVFHELVHNRYVVNSLRKRGVFFINDINKAPNGSILVFSAHGVSKTVRIKAMQSSLNILDATCPLVAKVHMEMLHASIKGKEAILIGHSGHPEVEGTIGQYSNLFGNVHLVESENDVWSLKVNHINDLCYMTQTTLSIFETKKIIRALKIRFPNIAGPKKDDICYATTNRQNAVRVLVDKVDIVFVVGSKKSSNSNRLMEVARYYGKLAYLIEDDTDIDISWLNNMNIIGITAGASTPNFLVNKVIDRLVVFSKQNCVVEELVGEEEKVFFKLPRKCLIKV